MKKGYRVAAMYGGASVKRFQIPRFSTLRISMRKLESCWPNSLRVVEFFSHS